jgi:predicted Zn-dependent peptidase
MIDKSLANIKTFEFPNGLRLIYTPNKLPITGVSMMVKVGSINEPRHLYGVSHFLEHMLFKGTSKRPTTMIISKELDIIGADYNAYTDKDLTCYICKAESKYLERMVDILSDMLCDSFVREKEMNIEKDVVIEEIIRGYDNPASLIADKVYEIIYKGNPLSHDIGGDSKTIKSYKHKDIVDFYKDNYCPNNIVISICSDLDFESIKNIVSECCLAKMEKQCGNDKVSMILDKQKGPRFIFKDKELEQANIIIGYRTCNQDGMDKWYLELLSIIIGGNMSSRLFMLLREENGLSYSVSAESAVYEASGHFQVQTAIDKDKLIKNKEKEGGIPLIMRCLLDIKNGKKPITKEELEKAKGYMRGQLVLQEESALNISDFNGKVVLFKEKPEIFYHQVDELIEMITLENLQSVIDKYFNPDRLCVAIIGKYDKRDFEEIKQLITDMVLEK